MSPDYPPQTIADSPRKGGYFLVREPGRALGSARLSISLSLSLSLFLSAEHLRELTASFLRHFRFSSPFLFPHACTPPCMFFFLLSFLSWKGRYRFEKWKGRENRRDPFVEAHLWLLGPKRTILEDRGRHKCFRVVPLFGFFFGLSRWSTRNLIFQMRTWVRRCNFSFKRKRHYS